MPCGPVNICKETSGINGKPSRNRPIPPGPPGPTDRKGMRSRLIPDAALSEQTFAARHRVLRVLLWAHVPVILVLAFFAGELAPGRHAPLLLAVLGAVMVCGVLSGTA